jgi:hypothetical protein
MMDARQQMLTARVRSVVDEDGVEDDVPIYLYGLNPT